MRKRMLLSLFRLWSVARYEARLVARSMLFWILFIFLFLEFAVFLIYSRRHDMQAIAANVPFQLFTQMAPFLGIFTLFAAVDSLERERTVSTSRMLHSRAFSNGEYLLGKALGVFLAMLGAASAFLLVLAVIGRVFFQIPFAPIGFVAPLLMGGPAALVLTGIAFLSLSLLRNKAVVISLLVVAYWEISFVYGSAGDNLLDYAGIRFSFLYSDLIGFSNFSSVLIQRGFWFLSGVVFILLAAMGFRRTPNHRERLATIALAVILFAGAAALGNTYLSEIRDGRELRKQILALSREISEKPRVTVTDSFLHIRHAKRRIEASAVLQFGNQTDTPIDRYDFSLNPGLEVSGVTRGGKRLPFSRNLHIVTVTPDAPLLPGGTDSLTIRYGGRIHENACYADIGEDMRKKRKRNEFLPPPVRYAHIGPHYVILTPECQWYPTAGAPFGSAFPRTTVRDFTRFTVRVESDAKLLPVSQGAARKERTGVWVFTPEYPLPQVSLVIGKYERRAISVDGVEYALYTHPAHDYFSGCFTELPKRLPKFIRNHREYYESLVGSEYPFRRLTLLETPVSFTAYRRFWSAGTEKVQPETVFLSEMGSREYYSDFQRPKRYLGFYSMEKMTAGEIQEKQAGLFVRDAMLELGSSPQTNIFPNFYHFVNTVVSEQYPLLDSMISLSLHSRLPKTFSMTNEDSMFETASKALSRRSPREALVDSANALIADWILESVSHDLFARLDVTFDRDAFGSFLREYRERTRGRAVPAESLFTAFRDRFGGDMEAEVNRALDTRGLPACIVTDVRGSEFSGMHGSLYQIRFSAYNPNPVDGVFEARISYEEGASGALENTPQPNESISRTFILPAGVAKEIGFILDHPSWADLDVDTFLSDNLPGKFTLRVPEKKPKPSEVPFEGERILDEPAPAASSGEIIVDNDDPGFEVLPGPEPGLFRRLIHRDRKEEGLYGGFREHRVGDLIVSRDSGRQWIYEPPNHWIPAAESSAWGTARKTAHVIKSGKGNQAVRWTGPITEKGRYAVYFFVPEWYAKFSLGMRGSILMDFHFRIETVDGLIDRTIVVSQTEGEWISLGTYTFPAGSAIVELTDQTKGKAVYSDAVKWVKQ